MKKILAFILVLATLLSFAVIPSFAVEDLGMVIVCDDFTIKITGENECAIIEYTGTDSKVIIPEKIEEKTVSSIGDYAFAYNRYVGSVTIPETVHTIGDGAFLFCSYMTRINVPASIETIGEKAFGFNRRNLDLETLTYSYRADFAFSVYAPENSAAADFAVANNLELNQDEQFNDFVFYIDFSIPYQWTDFNEIYAQLWELETNDDSFSNWKSEKVKCTVWYDHVEFNIGWLHPDSVYAVVFSTDTGEETFPAIFDPWKCAGDQLYTYDTYLKTAEDDKPRLKTKWGLKDLSTYEEVFGIYDGAYECTPDEATPDETTPDEPALSWGDVNCDGAVNVRDATEIQKHIAGLTTLSDTGLILGHFIGKDLGLDIKHATGIQRYCASLRTYEKIGKPAITRVSVERPHEWYRKEMKAVSWNDAGKVSYLNDASENKTNTDHALFLVPVYNPYIVLTCDGYETDTYTVDFYGNDRYGNSDLFCECFGMNDDGKIIFIWTSFA